MVRIRYLKLFKLGAVRKFAGNFDHKKGAKVAQRAFPIFSCINSQNVIVTIAFLWSEFLFHAGNENSFLFLNMQWCDLACWA